MVGPTLASPACGRSARKRTPSGRPGPPIATGTCARPRGRRAAPRGGAQGQRPSGRQRHQAAAHRVEGVRRQRPRPPVGLAQRRARLLIPLHLRGRTGRARKLHRPELAQSPRCGDQTCAEPGAPADKQAWAGGALGGSARAARTMSSALPWSAVTSQRPPTAATSSSSSCAGGGACVTPPAARPRACAPRGAGPGRGRHLHARVDGRARHDGRLQVARVPHHVCAPGAATPVEACRARREERGAARRRTASAHLRWGSSGGPGRRRTCRSAAPACPGR